MSIEQLIHDCSNNDRKAQEQLYRIYSAKLFGVCLKYSRSYAEAQDNMQEGFLTIFDKINQFKFKGSFEGWMKRIMINNILQKYRNEPFLNPIKEDFVDDTEIDIDEESVTLDYLMAIIRELPNRYRLVFNLYVIDGYSHQEVAEMMGISVGTSKSNLARAKMILKEKIENNNSPDKNFPKAK